MLTIKEVKKATPDKTATVQVIKLTGEIGGLVVCDMGCLGLKQGLVDCDRFDSTACRHIRGYFEHHGLPGRRGLPHALDVPDPSLEVLFAWKLRVVVDE